MKKKLDSHYERLPEYAKNRKIELSELYLPFINVTDRYGKLLCHLCVILGKKKPINLQDKVIRDLMSDVFDFLYESKEMIICAKLNIAFPLARRAYESLSLLSLCANDKYYAEKWELGKKFNNSEVRKELSKQTFGEKEDDTREFYKFFSLASHPNRELIPNRFLGEGNKFVFGSIGRPNLLLTTDYCLKHLNLWFWFGALVSYYYSKIVPLLNKDYSSEYLYIAAEAKKVGDWLRQNYNHLLREENIIK